MVRVALQCGQLRLARARPYQERLLRREPTAIERVGRFITEAIIIAFGALVFVCIVAAGLAVLDLAWHVFPRIV